MNEQPKPILKPILKGLLIFLAFVITAVLYVVIDSRIHRQRDTTSPEAYGVDSLEPLLEPPIDIEIWQKNEKLSDSPDPYAHMTIYEPQAKYYTRIHLNLEPGTSITTTFNPMSMPSPHDYSLIATMFYDLGSIRCTYDIPMQALVTSKASSDLVPAIYSGEINADNSDAFQSPNGIVIGNRSFSVSISDEVRNMLLSRYEPAYKTTYAEIYLRRVESEAGVNLNDFYKLEKLKEVYPDAPYELANLQRIVLTTHLTVEAMHPTKPDIALATVVLEIKSYSWWLESDSFMASVFEEAGIPNNEYSVVTVVSYEQSDALLLEEYS